MLVGDNSLVHELRMLTSIELFLNANFYSEHSCFLSAAEEHPKNLRLKNLSSLSVSLECLDSGLANSDLVKQEAILNCSDKKWSSFLCILGLSSILSGAICTYYPDCGELKYKLLFNRKVQPRWQVGQKPLEDFHILFCYVMKVLFSLVKLLYQTILCLFQLSKISRNESV